MSEVKYAMFTVTGWKAFNDDVITNHCRGCYRNIQRSRKNMPSRTKHKCSKRLSIKIWNRLENLADKKEGDTSFKRMSNYLAVNCHNPCTVFNKHNRGDSV